MCGVAGTYVAVGSPDARPLLLHMAGDLAHRGPDGVGLYLDGRFGMVNTRLAIIDLADGDQPIGDERGRYWGMQNGEIYNYLELRIELIKLGHVFRTSSDTEVLVHAYEEWGADCLHRLNGEFAVAIWDRDRRELFLARDRFGVRPLFVSRSGGDFSFASEAKALLRHPGAHRRLDPLGLVDAFTLWSTLPDRSAFEGIRELAPGHSLVVGPAGVRDERRWWEPTFAPAEAHRSEDELADELRELLRDAIRIRLRADVPVAAYLSGGIDSSLLVALARDVMTSDITSFGVGFGDPRFDESAYQDLAVGELGTRFTRIRVDAADIAASLPAVVEHAEKPTLRTAPAPLLMLSAAVREAGLKVVLTGEGADEIFAGYDIFREDKIRRWWARHPEERWRGMPLTRLHAFVGGDLGRAAPFVLRFYERGLTDTQDPLYSHRIRFSNTARCLRLFDADVLAEAARRGDPEVRLAAGLPPGFHAASPLGRAQHLEIVTFLEGYLLHTQGDRMLMANSVEGRFPYLDHRLTEFAGRLPDGMKLKALEEKHILRRAGAPVLPQAITTRRKHPYRAPVVDAFVGEHAPDYVGELLSSRAVDDAGIFSGSAVRDLVTKCGAAGASGVSETDEMALVGVLSTMLLHRRFVIDPPPSVAATPNRVVIGSDVDPSTAPSVSLVGPRHG
ncbi:MAG: asparagine synthase (glutamine-hydrolyzing) [Actinomycetota bacterium]